jgi:hypothetical protein
MRISQYPEHLINLGFKKRTLTDKSGYWYEKKVSYKGVGYLIEVDLQWKRISIVLNHKVKNGPHLLEDLKVWKLNSENLSKVLMEWDSNYY